MTTHATPPGAGHTGGHGTNSDLKKTIKGIAFAVVGLIVLVVIYRSCYPSSGSSTKNNGSDNDPKTKQQSFSYTMPVTLGKEYGDPVYLPAGYDFSFINMKGEYCVKNSDSEACGNGDLSGELSHGSINTKGLWFKGDSEGSLEILLVKNNNL